jgi:hypothetical protein
MSLFYPVAFVDARFGVERVLKCMPKGFTWGPAGWQLTVAGHSELPPAPLKYFLGIHLINHLGEPVSLVRRVPMVRCVRRLSGYFKENAVNSPAPLKYFFGHTFN